MAERTGAARSARMCSRPGYRRLALARRTHHPPRFSLYAQGRLQFAEQFASTPTPPFERNSSKPTPTSPTKDSPQPQHPGSPPAPPARKRSGRTAPSCRKNAGLPKPSISSSLDTATKRYRARPHHRTLPSIPPPMASFFQWPRSRLTTNASSARRKKTSDENEEDIPEPGSRWKPDTAA